MRKNGIVAAIDGPSGTGKSSVGKLAAQALGYSFLSTGEMYRALGYKALQSGIDMADAAAVTRAAQSLKLTFKRQPDAVLRMFVDGVFLGDKLHDEAVGSAASKTSAVPGAREVLTNLMREIGRNGGVIMEGRDIGTVVFPDAEVKFYIDAAPEARAERRYKQLVERGESANYDEILEGIKERDHRDSTRAAAPLKAAPDAIIIDTSTLTLNEVVEKVLKIIKKHL
ncbi:MAG: (d)CMP kinase [Elusimicrobia bacterium]|nr:(d)CMP kinase [Elusimicrobiota bacterium]